MGARSCPNEVIDVLPNYLCVQVSRHDSASLQTPALDLKTRLRLEKHSRRAWAMDDGGSENAAQAIDREHVYLYSPPCGPSAAMEHQHSGSIILDYC